MGWEFAAVWVDDPARAWKWMWRRIGDDSGAVLEHSAQFARLEDCIEDACRNGFEQSGCGPVD
ncbi:MAG TPA: hypothetical protein VGP15_00255 [Burkholderiales bacterium]|jgi:hypothetical protein|nr:hypothetical protein [Burkholderiales bacterium]